MVKTSSKIYFVGGLFPEYVYDDIINASRGVVQYAADSLQKSILVGLSELVDDCEIVNLPFIGSYPMRFRKLFIRTTKFDFTSGGKTIKGENVRFVNLTGYKLYSRYKSLRHFLREKISSLKENRGVVLLVYSVHTPFLKACVEVKKENPNVRIIQIVPDLPEFMSPKKTKFRSLCERYNSKIQCKLYEAVDGYVLLSKYMSEKIPVNGKPWVVMEGIYNEVEDFEIHESSSNEKYILYTGTLAKRYGILNLVKAFRLCKDLKCKLYICGDGDARSEIIQQANIDKRIIYCGQVKREYAIKLQKKATLLVNPRTPEGDFTKFSFPSKTMEYLASGIPTLLYMLPGIPEEYYKYCFCLSDMSILALADKIKEIISMDERTLKEKGKKAREFILKEKSPYKQVSKIVSLINNL